MTNLKTLKDLEFECEWKFDTLKALKAEAMKWAKSDKRKFRVITRENTAESPHISPGGTTLIIEDNSKVTEFELDINLRRFLFYFFNLTEEDLKYSHNVGLE